MNARAGIIHDVQRHDDGDPRRQSARPIVALRVLCARPGVQCTTRCGRASAPSRVSRGATRYESPKVVTILVRRNERLCSPFAVPLSAASDLPRIRLASRSYARPPPPLTLSGFPLSLTFQDPPLPPQPCAVRGQALRVSNRYTQMPLTASLAAGCVPLPAWRWRQPRAVWSVRH